MTRKERIAQLEDLKCHCEIYQKEAKMISQENTIWDKDVEALTESINDLNRMEGYQDTITRLIHLLTDLGWKKPENQMPEEYEHVLIQTNIGEMHEAYFANGKCHIVGMTAVDLNTIKAWRPRPEEYREVLHD